MRLDIHCAASATEISDPDTGDQTLQLNISPGVCTGVDVEGTSGIQWCTIRRGSGFHNWSLYREAQGNQCQTNTSSASLQVSNLIAAKLWSVPTCTEGSGEFPAVRVILAANPNYDKHPNNTYKIDELITLRNSGTAC